jgi:hypothetical protein
LPNDALHGAIRASSNLPLIADIESGMNARGVIAF